MTRLLLDQGVPRSTARLLNETGWDAVHVGDIGMSRASDDEILAAGRRDERVCVTLDADFHALLATGGHATPSVIRIRWQGLNADAMAALLRRVWPTVADRLATGAVVTVTEQSVRIRSLPVGPVAP